MKLKSLEIKGFKSFAHETVINFEEDVIGIVGPNGSGKSNIVDAIRWVLGEQKSRELRLDQMSSVIFNGTKKRKASGMAQVSLTFENTKNLLPTDYHAVTITRILYRTGESEYRLNNVPCRLKDITSLFLDTGIGSNSYAIIALGMVDDILNDKENARRRMFEQASGISKYKVRKRETMNKLKNTSNDLDRVEDLLFEIESNLNELEKQARRTQRYFDLKARYKELSTQLALIKAHSVKQKQEELKQKLTQEEDRYRSLEAQNRKLEAAVETEKKVNLDKEKNLSERQRELNQVVGQIRSLENDRKMADQQLQFNTQNQGRLKDQIQTARQKIQELDGNVQSQRENLQEEKRLEATLEEQLEVAEKHLAKVKENHSLLKSDLDVVVEEQQQIEREYYEQEKKRAINNNQIDNLQSARENAQRESVSRQDNISDLKKQIQLLEEQENQLLEKLQKLEAEDKKRQGAIQEAEQQQEELRKKVEKVNRQLDAKKNEYQLTKSMVENLEGFPESIKFLSQNKNWNQETPLLSDLIYVQEDYRVAIENYLEPYLNHYVVQNLEEAFQAIRLLNQTQKGKANFFLLDAFKGYEAPMVMLPDTTQAIELVETEDKYRPLISHLLENVLLTEKEENAERITEPNLVLISKSGRFIQRKYSISGGSVGLFEGKKIGRKKNLEMLELAIEQAEKEENRLSTSLYNLHDKLEKLKKSELPAQIHEQNLQLNQLAQEKVSLLTRMENAESYVQETSIKQTEIDLRIQELNRQNEEIDQQLNSKRSELEASRNQIASTDSTYKEVAEKLSKASAAFNEKNIEFIRQQNRVGSIQRELAFLEKQKDETSAQLKRFEQSLQEAETEITQIRTDQEKIDKDLQEAYKLREQKASFLTEAEQAYFKARGGINELEEQIRKVNRQQQEAQVLINQLREKQSELRFQMTSINERLQIEFSININDIINQEPEIDTPLPELEEKVGRIKNRLDNYGEINPMAVEAYDEMKERYDTIKEQRDDIEKAKADLLETIQEIEETATKQFLDSFEQARLYFIDVFRSLFTEDDNCDLILLDPENPLESKIEIVAKPKGKRPQTISQLSGGEKTLTATALLFALYLLKPAPFCVFDEVDAPLDDANIEKFNRIIKKFSKNSQFIIVTHNKATMAAVDIIYGVYMEEQGVSGVSPVDFRNFEHKGLLQANS